MRKLLRDALLDFHGHEKWQSGAITNAIAASIFVIAAWYQSPVWLILSITFGCVLMAYSNSQHHLKISFLKEQVSDLSSSFESVKEEVRVSNRARAAAESLATETKKKADLWEGLMRCEEVIFVGGVVANPDPMAEKINPARAEYVDYTHIGIELWMTEHPYLAPPDTKLGPKAGRRILTKFAERSIERRRY